MIVIMALPSQIILRPSLNIAPKITGAVRLGQQGFHLLGNFDRLLSIIQTNSFPQGVTTMSIAETLRELKRGTVEIIVEDELKTRLAEGKPMRIKLGMDPTAADIHLGHTVVLNKLRQFQQFGHHVQFLIGDFTAMIGDPTGKNVMRQPLTREEIVQNAQTYQAQVFKILDAEKTEIVFNSTWMDKVSAAEMMQIASLQTVARMLEREDFQNRYKENQPIAIHEFLYPLMQGFDSVKMQTDVELGGTDQKFNLLMGREMQRHFHQRQQCILMTPLLEGLDGVKKMSKSLGNYIGITDTADDMFGKIMSISDEIMWRYYELLSFRRIEEIELLYKAVEQGKNPRDIKFELAKEIVARFHDKKTAEAAKQTFIDRFCQHELPQNLVEMQLSCNSDGLGIAYILKQAGLVSSTSEAIRLIQQGAVRIDGERVSDFRLQLPVGAEHVMQVGRRKFAKIRLTS